MSQEVEMDADLRRIVFLFWDRRRLIALSGVLGVMVGLAVAIISKPVFRSEALLMQNQPGGATGGGLGALAGQLGGLADLAGLYVHPGTESKAMALAVLQSRVLLEQFILDNKLLPVLFPREWNDQTGNWKSADPRDVPTVLDGCEVIRSQVLRVSEDKKSGLVTVAMEWTDAATAARWLTDLIDRANRYLKQQALSESEANLKYLEKQAKQNSAVELKQATYALIEAELKKQMVAMSADQFALKVIDPPATPRKRIRPHRKMIVVIGALAGLFGGVIVVLSLAAFASLRRVLATR